MTAIYDDMPHMKALMASICPEALQMDNKPSQEETREEEPEEATQEALEGICSHDSRPSRS